MPRAMRRGEGVTYDDARTWFAWMGRFTVGDLADAMDIDDGLAARFVKAGTWAFHNGHVPILRATGEMVNGTYRGLEEFYEYIEITKPNPTVHPTYPLEWKPGVIPGVGELAPPNRGMPVRIRTDRDTRRLMSTPGARSNVIQSEKRYEEMLKAQAEAKAKAARKAAREKDIGNRHKYRGEDND